MLINASIRQVCLCCVPFVNNYTSDLQDSTTVRRTCFICLSTENNLLEQSCNKNTTINWILLDRQTTAVWLNIQTLTS